MLSLDALVIGGGPAGATAALLLARAGWRVGLLEKSEFPRQKVCGEFVSAANLPLLQRIGVANAFLEMAGPEVRRVGLFAGEQALFAEMPHPYRDDEKNAACRNSAWGRALGRDRLDTLLLERAVDAGAKLWQPWLAAELEKSSDSYLCTAVSRSDSQSLALRARVVIAAHGSWEPGGLPTQFKRPAARPGDLFGFKAHFLGSRLPDDLMPLLAFPGGYGGMVHSDNGRVSLSCCIRRDELERARRTAENGRAAEAVLQHIGKNCRAAREILRPAMLEHAWLSAGPIRPGIRGCGRDSVFLAGNAAGEAHPVIAEGIGMAMQSARLLADRLIAAGSGAISDKTLDSAQVGYASDWRRLLAPRIRTAALVAHWAMRPAAVACSLPLLRYFPAVLTAGARLSGKAA